AGKTLVFDVEIIGVREADENEIQHGHVHGDGGVQH
ncbi:MAG TPA: peptidylprolyl isomerase, partial [Arenimonas sp.]|nr:peptidylprolyl isomerase [Arenimonas sp.]